MRCTWLPIFALLAGCTADLGAGMGADAGAGSDATTADSDAGDIVDPQPHAARYSADALRSPITTTVVESMRAIYTSRSAPADWVFMKVGASGTVSSRFLDCFAGDNVDLDGRAALQETIDYYNAVAAGDESSWNRTTIAAKVGHSAGWVISEDPSPLDEEIAAINPRAALVNYGTNDMGLGSTHETAMWPFVDNFTALLDELEDAGIIPIITGLNPRSDYISAARWVPTYNTVTRAIAEARQLPYINMYRASVDLPDMGMVSDGIHGNVYVDGSSRPCVFTSEALEFNYNIRNLLTLETLHDVRETVMAEAVAPDADTDRYSGLGAPDDPFVVDRLPFTHHADTSASSHDLIDAYPACDDGQDESGPELYYRLDIAETTPMRILVLDGDGVDVDIHLLDGSLDAASCIARAHRIIERTLEPGTYYVAVDTWVSGGGDAQAGNFSLVALECEPGDARCQ
jgi:hypothetical protein